MAQTHLSWPNQQDPGVPLLSEKAQYHWLDSGDGPFPALWDDGWDPNTIFVGLSIVGSWTYHGVCPYPAPMTQQFHVRVNERQEQTISVETGDYLSAVAAVPALLGAVDYPLEIEIWVPDLLPDYGPYKYRIGQAGSAVDSLIAAGHRNVS
jgi:hypothetical protein